MNLLHLRYICEVAKCGSISKAAHNLYMNQPRLSKIIKDLENDLNLKIFERTSQGVTPTKKGLLFINQAKIIIDEVEHLENICQNHPKTVTLDVSVPRASYISIAFVKYLHQANLKDHKVKINYHETNSNVAIQQVYDDEVEIAIIRLPVEDKEYYLNIFEFKDLKYKEIFRFHYQLMMSKNNSLAQKDVYFHDLQDQIELLHGDIQLPDTPLTTTTHLQHKPEKSKVINIYERGSQFEILSNLEESYMWASPVPQETLECFHLVQKECLDMKKEFIDMLIYRKGYELTRENNEFIDKIYEVIQDIQS